MRKLHYWPAQIGSYWEIKWLGNAQKPPHTMFLVLNQVSPRDTFFYCLENNGKIQIRDLGFISYGPCK